MNSTRTGDSRFIGLGVHGSGVIGQWSANKAWLLANLDTRQHVLKLNMLEVRTPFYAVSAGELIGGKYRVDGVIGEGGMGVVFAATHLDLHCTVALKVIRPEFQQQPDLVARLMLEARAAAQIRSEHVCRVLDVARLESGVPYVVMEYLEGKNLAKLLETKGRLSEKVAVDYILQACEALAEAHRIGIIHRDLKPENLFLAEFPDGRRAIKVLDFGISKMLGGLLLPTNEGLTNPSAAMGSPLYMAPEQMAAARDVDARADIWALGAILYQLVTGRIAFDGTSLPAVCAAVLQHDPVPVREYVEELSLVVEQAISACLVKDRSRRVGSVSALSKLIAPLGSSSSTQSALRISRLMHETSESPESTENSGTLPSPRQLPTPRTPIQRATEPTTEQALTSSKRSFTVPGSSARMRRTRLYVAVTVVLLVAAVGWTLRMKPTNQEPSAAASTPFREPWAPNSLGLSAAAEASPPRESPSVAAKEPARSEQTVALRDETPPAIVTPTPSVATPSIVVASRKPDAPEKTTTHVTAAPSPRKSAAGNDPYNLDNFGGRR